MGERERQRHRHRDREKCNKLLICIHALTFWFRPVLQQRGQSCHQQQHQTFPPANKQKQNTKLQSCEYIKNTQKQNAVKSHWHGGATISKPLGFFCSVISILILHEIQEIFDFFFYAQSTMNRVKPQFLTTKSANLNYNRMLSLKKHN